jgi:YVTN family beta-propeller protein
LIVGGLVINSASSATLFTPSHSTTIALTSEDRRVVVNREANSLSIIRVRNAQGLDIGIKLDEIVVGLKPRCVAVSPDDREAYVTNAISDTVSVVSLIQFQVVATIPVETEPWGCGWLKGVKSSPQRPSGLEVHMQFTQSSLDSVQR